MCRTIVGDPREVKVDIQATQLAMEKELADQKITAFPEVNIVPDFDAGVIGIIQANGLAGLHSNTIMFGWPENPEGIL